MAGKDTRYYVYRVSKRTERKDYKRYKTLDTWVGEGLKDQCWKFSKQGATGIVKVYTERAGVNYEYGFEEAMT